MLIKYIIEDSVVDPIYLIGTLKGESPMDWGFFGKNDRLGLIRTYFHAIYYPLDYRLASPG